MKEKTIRLLTFEELNEEQKEKVLDNYRDINSQHDFSDFDYPSTEEVEKYFEYTGMNYSLSYSQGDGARILVSGIKKKAISLIYKSKSKSYKTLMRLFNNDEFYITQDLDHSNYVHYNTFSLDYFYSGNNDDHNKLIAEFCDSLQDYLREKSKQLEKELYAEIEGSESDEAVADTLICNEYHFNEETLKIDN